MFLKVNNLCGNKEDKEVLIDPKKIKSMSPFTSFGEISSYWVYGLGQEIEVSVEDAQEIFNLIGYKGK